MKYMVSKRAMLGTGLDLVVWSIPKDQIEIGECVGL